MTTDDPRRLTDEEHAVLMQWIEDGDYENCEAFWDLLFIGGGYYDRNRRNPRAEGEAEPMGEHKHPTIADGNVDPKLVEDLRRLVDSYGKAGVRQVLDDPDLSRPDLRTEAVKAMAEAMWDKYVTDGIDTEEDGAEAALDALLALGWQPPGGEGL